MNLVDTHCHLNFSPLSDDLENVLKRAAQAGVNQIVVPGYDLASWNKVEEIAKRKNIFPAFGLHPWVADQKLNFDELENRLIKTNAVAMGEIGLDFKVDISKDRQMEILKKQLQLAQKLNLPVLLHCRGAFEEMIEILEGFNQNIKGVIHAFSKGSELAKRFENLNLHLAFGGAITRPNAKRPRRSAKAVSNERLLLETDAPSIGLEAIEPSKVEPAHIKEIAAAAAQLRETTIEEIAKITTSNAKELFGF